MLVICLAVSRNDRYSCWYWWRPRHRCGLSQQQQVTLLGLRVVICAALVKNCLCGHCGSCQYDSLCC